MDDYDRQAFEKECQYYGVRFVYGDAPSGMDMGSMFARCGISLGNYLRVKTNRESALAGNIGPGAGRKSAITQVPLRLYLPRGKAYQTGAIKDQPGETSNLKGTRGLGEGVLQA